MRLLITIILLALLGCAGQETAPPDKENVRYRTYLFSGYSIKVVEIEGCEYLFCTSQTSITHKANCKNPEHKCP